MKQLPQPVIQNIGDTGNVRLMENYALELPTIRATIFMDTGFVYDGASIPRCAWPLVGHPLQGDNLPGATAHDGLYRTQWVTRWKADRMVRERWVATGKSRAKAWLMWSFVRALGGASWNRYTVEEINAARKQVRLVPVITICKPKKVQYVPILKLA